MKHKIFALMAGILLATSCAATGPDQSSSTQPPTSASESQSGATGGDDWKDSESKSEYVDTIEPTPDDEDKPVDLSKFRLKNVGEYSSLGFASMEAEQSPSRKSRVKRLLAEEADGSGASTQDIAYSFSELLHNRSLNTGATEYSDYPFYLVGEKESGATEVLEFNETKESAETEEADDGSKLDMAAFAEGDASSDDASSETPESSEDSSSEAIEESSEEASSEEESSSEETEEEGESSGAIQVRAVMDLGEFIAFNLYKKPSMDWGMDYLPDYSIDTEFPLFIDDYLAEHGGDGSFGATYILSKKTGNIYPAGSLEKLGITTDEVLGERFPKSYMRMGKYQYDLELSGSDSIAVGAGSRIVVGLISKTLICEEVDGTLQLKLIGSRITPNYVDKYGNMLLNDGTRIFGADLKAHKITSYLGGAINRVEYNHGLKLLYAKVDGKTYVLNDQCEFVEYDAPQRSILTESADNLTTWEYGGADSYSADGVTIDYYDDIRKDGDPLIFPIDCTKPYSWAPIALYWLSIRNSYWGAAYDAIAEEFGVDKDALAAKLIEGKCTDATRDEITYIMRFAGLAQTNGGDSYMCNLVFAALYIVGDFNEDGLFEYDGGLEWSSKPINAFNFVSQAKKLYATPSGLDVYTNGGSVAIDGDTMIAPTASLYYRVLGYLSTASLRGSGWYELSTDNQVMYHDMDRYTVSVIDTGDIEVQSMSVVDGNIQVTGQDENFDSYTGYLTPDNTLSLEKVDLGALPSCVLYPVN